MSRLTIAVPSKGRLKDNAEAWLAACGFRLRQKGGTRGYQAELSGLDADVMLLSAREIAQGLIEGDLHLGVTGQDLLHDLSPNVRDAFAGDRPQPGPGSASVSVIRTLGFGGADVVVATPQAWLDVTTMADLEAAAAIFRQRHGRRMRVATKYMALTREFFARHGVGAYRIVESAGATEAAPASGAAEVIVDITSTGATLTANGLKTLDDGTILKSQAALAGSLKADWSETAREALNVLLDASEARALGEQRAMLIAARAIPDDLVEELGLVRTGDSSAQCARGQARQAARYLSQSGYGPVAVHNLEFVFEADNAVSANFLRQL